MRDPKRINKILKQFESIWSETPDLRFGQLFWIIVQHAGYDLDQIFYMKDELFIEAMNKWLKTKDKGRSNETD